MTRSLIFSATATLAATTFPIAELGDCRDANECGLYCEIPAHKAACWAYQTYQATAPAVLGETTTAFPIAELGNCTSVRECKAYCDIPANLTACRTFGQKQGLDRASTTFGQQTALLAHAKEELGCTSLQQCRAHCNDPTNTQQCQDLATQFAPLTYRVAREALLEQARLILQCTSLEECRAYCADPAHRQACQVFAQEHAPELFRDKMRTNLPCTTLAECQAYCSSPQHATACATARDGTGVRINVQHERGFTCNTKEECERYCQANPDQCPSYAWSKDYERVKLQQQLRAQVNQKPRTLSPADLEKYRRGLIVPSSAPTN